MRRLRLHRTTFAAAGTYNIAWGCYAALDPQWFFRLTGLPLSNSPQIFACFGMVLGLYGVLYLEVARRPEHGWHRSGTARCALWSRSYGCRATLGIAPTRPAP